MVESRWLRSDRPGCRRARRGRARRIHDARRGRPAVGAARLCRTAGTSRRPRPRPARARSAIAGSAVVRLDPVLDGDGALRGQRLVARASAVDAVARAARARPPSRSRPARSAASSSSARMTARRSRLHAIDVARRLRAGRSADGADVIRRATIDPAGTSIYETRVDRATPSRPRHLAPAARWRRPGRRGPAADRADDALRADVLDGRSRGIAAGGRLAVQSCGEIACRTRVLDPRDGGDVRLVDDPASGSSSGSTTTALVAYAACRGLPCPIVSTTLATGRATRPRRTPGRAVVIATPDGPRLVHEVAGARRPPTPRRSRSTDPPRRDLGRSRTASGSWPGRRGRQRRRAARRLGPPRARTAACRSTAPTTARSSATSRTARPSRSTRRSDDAPRPRARGTRASPLAGARRGDRARSSADGRCRSRARPRPVPGRRTVRPEPGRSRSAGGPAPSRPRRSRPRSRPRPIDATASRASKAADLRLRRRRAEPDRLRGRGDLRRQRPRLLHPERARRLHDVAARAGPRLRLGHAQVVPDVHERRPTAATTPRRSRSTSSATSRASATTSTTPTTRTTWTRSSRPSRGRSRRRAGTCTTFGRCDVATLQLRYDMARVEREVLDLPRPRDGPDARRVAGVRSPIGGSTTLTATLKVVERRRATTASAATRSRAGRSPSSAARPARRRGSTVGTMPAASRAGHLRPWPSARRSDTEYRAVFKTPADEGHQRRHVADRARRRRGVAAPRRQACGIRAEAAVGRAVPCI